SSSLLQLRLPLRLLADFREKKNWVIRKEDSSDRRNRLIFLTIQGEELALTVKPLINDIYTQTGIEMEVSRINECTEDLKRLYEVLNEI
ncbi:hypothetical protein KSZ07_11125, partial [Bacteroides fragilis]|nr:hypothetical protein [Bacteroides fragilis]